MLLGTFQVILSLLPKENIPSTPLDTLTFLSSMIKAVPEQVKLAADHLKLMIEKFKEHNHLIGNFPNSSSIEGILDSNHLVFNIKSLSGEYSNKLLPDDIDERDFLLKETDISSPLKINNSLLPSAQRFFNKRVLEYDDDETLSMSSRLQDIKFPSLITNSPYSIKTFPPCSRMTTSLELETWLNTHLDSVSSTIPSEISEKLDSAGSHFLTELLIEFRSIIFEAFGNFISQKTQPSKHSKSSLQIQSFENKPSSDQVLRLFHKVLLELLRNEEKQQELRSDSKEQMSNVLTNETFYRALLVCCIETILYVNNITAFEFSEVLEKCKVSAFDS